MCDVVKSFLKSQFTSDSQSLIFLKTIINEITEYQLVELFKTVFKKSNGKTISAVDEIEIFL